MPRAGLAAYTAILAAFVSGCAQNTSSLPGAAGGSLRGGPKTNATVARPPVTLASCPNGAVFVRLDQEIRGYPLDVEGPTAPCAQIVGADTQLMQRGPLAVSKHGYLHSMSFQSNGNNALTIHAPDATGDAAPVRMAGADQDHIALAIDSHLNDYIVASQNYPADFCWYVVGDGQTTATTTNADCDANLQQISALTTNNADELIVAGTEAGTGRGRIDVYDAPASAAPQLVRSIVGPNTRIPSIGTTPNTTASLSFSLATDPASGSIYVYDSLTGGALTGAEPPKILQFAANATGDVAPLRTLWGPLVNLVSTVFGVNVLAVDYGGNLYSLSQGSSLVVSVFGPQARDNATPDRTFSDPTAVTQLPGLGVAASLAVRSSAADATATRRALRVFRR